MVKISDTTCASTWNITVIRTLSTCTGSNITLRIKITIDRNNVQISPNILVIVIYIVQSAQDHCWQLRTRHWSMFEGLFFFLHKKLHCKLSQSTGVHQTQVHVRGFMLVLNLPMAEAAKSSVREDNRCAQVAKSITHISNWPDLTAFNITLSFLQLYLNFNKIVKITTNSKGVHSDWAKANTLATLLKWVLLLLWYCPHSEAWITIPKVMSHSLLFWLLLNANAPQFLQVVRLCSHSAIATETSLTNGYHYLLHGSHIFGLTNFHNFSLNLPVFLFHFPVFIQCFI